MVEKYSTLNARHLEMELDWFNQILDCRMDIFFKKAVNDIYSIPAPDYPEKESMYASFIEHYKLTIPERLLLILALVPHIRPDLLDRFFAADHILNRGYTSFGGLKGLQHGGFIPTGETFMFIAAGNDLAKRFALMNLFDADHFFASHLILRLEAAPEGEPVLSGAIIIARDFIDYFTVGNTRKPDLSVHFPAKRISTQLEWKDLVLDHSTTEQLDEIRIWLQHGHTLLDDWGLKKRIRKGYRSLFYGPPGTGKSLTACLLGKYTGRDVYRIDLSLVVSKYIGETEKNLSRIFEKAEHKNWILFFDEADALFGRRTEISDAHDRYANQEVSYLLQRIEDFDGIVILASNMKKNLDDSFTRRFESIIHFPMPRAEERLRLWQQGFSDKSKLAGDVNLERIAKDYEISGGAIMNVIRYCSLMALGQNSSMITRENVLEGIRKEYHKEGKIM
jgi:hypothetical protein